MRVPLSWLREYVDLRPPSRPRRGRAAHPPPASRSRRSSSSAPTSTARWSSARCWPIEELTGFQQADPVLPGVHRDRRAAEHRLRRAQLRRRRQGVVSRCPAPCCPAASRSARKNLRPHLRRHDLLGRELAMGDDHSGIIVLPPDAPLGTDASAARAGRRGLDIAVTPDRGYCLSMRGVAREIAIAYGVATPTRPRPACPTTWRRCARGLPGEHRRPHRLRPVRAPRGARRRARRAHAALAAGAAGPVRDAPSRWPSTSPTT